MEIKRANEASILKAKKYQSKYIILLGQKTSAKNADDKKSTDSFIAIPLSEPSNKPSTGEAEVSLGCAKIQLSVSDAASLLISLHQAGVLHD